MRMLRWAAEQAAKEDTWTVGLATLNALGSSELLQPEDRGIINAVLDAVFTRPTDEYAEEVDAGEGDVDVAVDEDGG